MSQVKDKMVQLDGLNIPLSTLVANLGVVSINLFTQDGTPLVDAIDEVIEYMENAGGGEIIIPANATNDVVKIKVYKLSTSQAYHIIFEIRREDADVVRRPYTDASFVKGDIIINNGEDEAEDGIDHWYFDGEEWKAVAYE